MTALDATLITLAGSGALGCIVFVIAYWIKTKGVWRRSEAGRFLMISYATLGSILLLVLANSIFGEWPGRSPISLILLAIYCAEAWWPLRLLYRADQAEGKISRRVRG